MWDSAPTLGGGCNFHIAFEGREKGREKGRRQAAVFLFIERRHAVGFHHPRATFPFLLHDLSNVPSVSPVANVFKGANSTQKNPMSPKAIEFVCGRGRGPRNDPKSIISFFCVSTSPMPHGPFTHMLLLWKELERGLSPPHTKSWQRRS